MWYNSKSLTINSFGFEVKILKSIDNLLKEIKRVHFIGIGGSGMCPLAEILHAEGYEVSGSDVNESETLSRVRKLGIPVAMPQKAENIQGAEMIVYTAALLPDNPELCAAKASGIPTFERSKLFGAITRIYDNAVCISGTHGKTTVTSMLTQIMIEVGADPSAVIGGRLPLINSNGRVGHSENLVCEACEFVDTFLDLSPDVAVVLNIDEDHMDYFKTMDNLIHSFHKFCSQTTRTLVINKSDPEVLKAVEGIEGKKIITFGNTADCDFYPENIVFTRGAFARFDVCHGGECLMNVQLGIPGAHNVLNTLAAVAAAYGSGIDPTECKAAIEAFGGAGRRFEKLGEYCGITVFDDYAHHPAELEVTLNAAKSMDYKRVWAVFQPFTYSRTQLLMDDFARVLQIADRVVMTEIMGSREVNTNGVYTSQLAEKIPGSVWFNTFDEVANYVVDNAQSGDMVITLGCGDIYKAAKIMIKLWENKN